MGERVFVVLGNQLFPPKHLVASENATFFMAEDVGLCTYVRHHQQKIVLFLAAMRSYRDELLKRGLTVEYVQLNGKERGSYEDKLLGVCERLGCEEIAHFEVEDRFMEERLSVFAKRHGLRETVLQSPMFLCSRDSFAEYLRGAKRPFMADFYKRERKRLGLLVDDQGRPEGGKWSLDADNRKKLPKSVTPPEVVPPESTGHVRDVQRLVAKRFADHPGRAEDMWLPTTRAQALAWLRRFIDERLDEFGDYEDALTRRSPTVFHSVLSPTLNLGLITPSDVVERSLAAAEKRAIPLNSLEGFLRQIIGWREFIRGVYRRYGEQQEKMNFWSHDRSLTGHWYDGTTGIPPLDDTIHTAQRLGWTHHIPRLMVAGNLMTLCGIKPVEAYRWFMEMYVDSSDWVMVPNVYGMALFSDGGIFATKPYICGSNYLRKMSDYPAGDWCDVVDGLYWRFVEIHCEYFRSNHRLSMMTRALDRLRPERKARIYAAAEDFISACTIKAGV